MEDTIFLNSSCLNNNLLIAEKDIRPGPLRDQKKLDHLHFIKAPHVLKNEEKQTQI